MNDGLLFCKIISKEVCITCHFIFFSYPPLPPHNSVHFIFCFLQRQRFIQVVLHSHLMSSLQAWDASANVAQIGYIPFSLSFYPHSTMLISSDHFLFALHHILQNMNKNYAERIFINVQKMRQLLATFFSNLI